MHYFYKYLLSSKFPSTPVSTPLNLRLREQFVR